MKKQKDDIRLEAYNISSSAEKYCIYPCEDTARVQPALYLNLRVSIKGQEKFFGPGLARLLHLIDELGSIQAACQAMDMSYTKAWRIIKRASEELGCPLLVSHNGGSRGGESHLSQTAADFLGRYDAFCEALGAVAEELFEQYFKEWPGTNRPAAEEEKCVHRKS